MTLSYSLAPFSDPPGGAFNFRKPPVVLYWEPFPKRVRVEFGGVIVADSRRVKALHETGKFMELFFPRDDVKMEHLQEHDRRTGSPLKGTAVSWSVTVGDRSEAKGARSYEDLPESAPPMRDHLAFRFDAMDAFYEEDDRVYAHPRDPYHRFDVHNSSRHVVVRHAGKVIAESRRPRVLFETGIVPRYYVPPDDVQAGLLTKSETVSQCPYKGDGQHWNLRLDAGAVLRDAAWSLPRPLGEAEIIRDFFCFYSEKLEVVVDGERLGEA